MSSLEDLEKALRSLLAKLQDLDLWPPWDAAETIVDLVSTVVEVATQPPGPDPRDLESAAAAWQGIGSALSRGSLDIGAARTSLAAAGVWTGDAGDACRTSLSHLGARMDTVPIACTAVRRALLGCADDMRAARARHDNGYAVIAKHLDISWSDLWPWELVDLLKNIVGDVIHGVEELIGSYADAAAAVRRCSRSVVAALDEITLPDHLVAGTSAVTVVNGWQAGGDDSGPLRGSTLERADSRMAGMSPQDRAAVQRLLDEAPDDQATAWVLAALASGVALDVLGRFATRLGTMTPSDRAALDPTTALAGTFTQPDETTCGSSVLVMSRMLNDPAYAMYVMTGYDPRTGRTASSSASTPQDRFRDESLKMHEQTGGLTDHDGDPQVPWPDALGTTPEGVANQMGGGDGRSGVPGSHYAGDIVDPYYGGRTFDHIVTATQDGETVPLFIGDGLIPRHIVLVTASAGDALTVYDPSKGLTTTVSREDFENGHLGVAEWDQPWEAVTPH